MFIRAIRQKNNIPDIKAAYRCNVDLSEYLDWEEFVTDLAARKLSLLFKAIEMGQEDFVKYQMLASKQEAKRLENVFHLKKNE